MVMLNIRASPEAAGFKNAPVNESHAVKVPFADAGFTVNDWTFRTIIRSRPQIAVGSSLQLGKACRIAQIGFSDGPPPDAFHLPESSGTICQTIGVAYGSEKNLSWPRTYPIRSHNASRVSGMSVGNSRYIAKAAMNVMGSDFCAGHIRYVAPVGF